MLEYEMKSEIESLISVYIIYRLRNPLYVVSRDFDVNRLGISSDLRKRLHKIIKRYTNSIQGSLKDIHHLML